MNVIDYIEKKLAKGRMHFSLLDPDESKMPLSKLEKIVKTVDDYGTDLFLVGGSTNVGQKFLDDFVRKIKEKSEKPVVLFPGGLNGITRHADAILFMSLMNSTDPFWIVGAQAKGAPIIKKLGIESIPMAYLIVEPGMKAGQVSSAKPIKHNEPEKAVEYALAAQHFGMKLVYLEAGSGAPTHVPAKMVKMVKDAVDIPLIVGGGIRTPDACKELLDAGADIIDTGTQIENDVTKLKSIIDVIHEY